MKRRLFIFAFLALALTVGAVIAFKFFDREPRLEGRPVSAWVDELRRGTSEQKGRAAQILQNAGPETADYLARGLGKGPSFVQRASARTGRLIPENLRTQLRKVYNPTKKIIDQYTATEALRLMGTNARVAIPALGAMLNDPNVLLSASAGRALSAMGTNAVGPLTTALNHADFNVRAAACNGLANLGPAAAPAAPRLAQIVESEVGPITDTAAYALSRIGPPAVPHLLPLLQSTNARVRLLIANTFGSMGPGATNALPDLMLMAKDPDSRLRQVSIHTLGQIDPTSRVVSAVAIDALQDAIENVRSTALQVLRYRPRAVLENVEKIAARLDDESPYVRGYAALALTAAPKQARSWLPRLRELAMDTNVVLQASAQEALKVIEPAHPNEL